jgi:hypothetical protein
LSLDGSQQSASLVHASSRFAQEPLTLVQGFEVVQGFVVVAPLPLMPEYVAELVGYTMGGLVGEPPALTFVSVGVVDP